MTAAPVANWAGFYAGSMIGEGFTSVRTSQTTSRTKSLTGTTGGALLGYNWQAGRVVYGLEGDIALHLIRGNTAGRPGLIATHDDSLYSARLRGHLGYDLGNFQPFMTGGVATNEFYLSGVGPTADFGQNRQSVGWTAGVGLDWRVNAPFFGPLVLRGEYVYENFGSNSYRIGPDVVRAKQDTSYVRAALIYIPGLQPGPMSPIDPNYVDWSGAYAGVIGGGNWITPKTTSGGLSRSFTVSGPAGGIYLGRNFQFGHWVVGFDGTTELSDASGRGSFPGIARTDFRQNIEGDARARVGYAFGRFLPFFAAGATFTRSEQRDLATGSQRGRVPADSFTVGGGLDYRLSERWSVRGEYLYASTLKSKIVPLDGCVCRQSQNSETVRFGLAYHFE